VLWAVFINVIYFSLHCIQKERLMGHLSALFCFFCLLLLVIMVCRLWQLIAWQWFHPDLSSLSSTNRKPLWVSWYHHHAALMTTEGVPKIVFWFPMTVALGDGSYSHSGLVLWFVKATVAVVEWWGILQCVKWAWHSLEQLRGETWGLSRSEGLTCWCRPTVWLRLWCMPAMTQHAWRSSPVADLCMMTSCLSSALTESLSHGQRHLKLVRFITCLGIDNWVN